MRRLSGWKTRNLLERGTGRRGSAYRPGGSKGWIAPALVDLDNADGHSECRPGGAGGQHAGVGREPGVYGLVPEHKPDPADGAGRGADDVSLSRRLGSDDFHFNAPPSYTGQGTDAAIASFIASVKGVGLVTIDYGSGSPQEAAAFLAYLERPRGQHDPDRQRPGMERLDECLADCQLAERRLLGEPARRRAPWLKTTASTSSASTTRRPSTSSTGRSATRNTGAGRSTTTPLQHDPATYIAFAKQFQTYAASNRTRNLDRSRRRESGKRLQQLDRQHPAAMRPAKV